MKKRFLSVLLLLCLCLSLLPAAAAANGDWSFDAASGTLRMSGSGTMEELFEETSSVGNFMTYSYFPWVEHSDAVRAVEIGAGITTIGSFAFNDFSQLTTIVVPEGVTHIGSFAFSECGALQSITLPASLQAIESFAFDGCSSLRQVSFTGSEAQWAQVKISGFNEALSEASIQYTGTGSASSAASAPAAAPAAPSSGGGNSVSGLWGQSPSGSSSPAPAAPSSGGDNSVSGLWGQSPSGSTAGSSGSSSAPAPAAPTGAATRSGAAGNNVTWSYYAADRTIVFSGSGAMTDYSWDQDPPWADLATSVTTAIVEPGVTTLGAHALRDFETLTSISLPEGLQSIGMRALDSCKALPEIYLPASLTKLPYEALDDCNGLLRIEVAAGNMSFRSVDGVLFNGNMQTLVFYPRARAGAYSVPSGVTEIGESAFEDCEALTSLTLPEGLTTIGYSAFDFCYGLQTVTFPSSLRKIDSFAFSNCRQLQNVRLPEGLLTLDTWSFHGCEGLTEITLPASLTAVDDGTFSGCDNLRSINVAAGNTNFRSVGGVLFSIDMTTLYALPGGIGGAYVVPDGVTVIYEDAMRGHSTLTEITLPASLRQIQMAAFSGCSKLVSVHFMGTQSQWESLDIASSNDKLLEANISYNG